MGKRKTKNNRSKKTERIIDQWFGKNIPTFKKWVKHFRITKDLLKVLFLLAPIGAISSLLLWFYAHYYITPWELINIMRADKSSLSGLDVLPGYLEISDLPGILEERKSTVDIIKEIMTEKNFTMYDLVDLARCESTYNPNAYNRSSGATGLFQYMKKTWGTTPYCQEDIWDTESQTLATIWMFEHNRFREWECFRISKLKDSAPYYIDYHGCGKDPE